LLFCLFTFYFFLAFSLPPPIINKIKTISAP
jgi:hypothetical protein